MGGKNRGLSDALILATMCFIGHPVDVHLKDGSVYSGIFHTACVENNYAIVLKKARMIKKGSRDANITSGGVLGTLTVLSEDLVQVVAKEVVLPANGGVGNVAGDDFIGNAPSLESTGKEAKTTWHTVSHYKENEVQRRKIVDKIQGSSSSSDACETQSNAVKTIHADITSIELPNAVPCDSLAPFIFKLDNPCQERYTWNDSLSLDAITSGVSTASASAVYLSSVSCPISSTPTEMVPPKSLSFSRTPKDFKLNSGAKMFSPSFAPHRSATPPAAPTVASVTYIQNHRPVDFKLTPGAKMFSPSFAPHRSATLPAAQTVASVTYKPDHRPVIFGYVGSRTQPVRYAGHYHPVQAGPAYVHPNSQNVTLGLLGPVVYMHPVSHDVVQSAASLSQAPTHTRLTPHPVHLPKRQGNTAAQTYHMRVMPPFIASAQQPFAVPSHIPISQPVFPVIHPILVPRYNGFMRSKFS